MVKGAEEPAPPGRDARRAASSVVIAGRYRVESMLGRGGMGSVFAARHVVTGRRFAVKLLGRALCGEPSAEERFTREALLASAIQHPAIVEVYDVGRHRGRPYMVMRLLQGETLSQRLKHGPLPPAEVIALLLPVIDAVAAAHAAGIVHRDLKPDNVMIEREGKRDLPRVLDFGVSKLIGEAPRSRLTHPGALIGTPDYMAPEQVRGDAKVDGRADIYALGVMLYEALTGKLPYRAEQCPALLRQILLGGAPGVRSHDPRLPEPLEAVIARAMHHVRESRHQSAHELAADLMRCAKLLDAAPAPAATLQPDRASTSDSLSPVMTVPVMRAQRAPRRWPYTALVLAACAAALVLAMRSWRASPGARPPQQASAVATAPVLPATTAPQPLLPAIAAAPAPPEPASTSQVSTTAARAPAASVKRSVRPPRRVAAAPLAPEPAADLQPEPPRRRSVPDVSAELIDPFD
jgi:serine/threonine-protein kinase